VSARVHAIFDRYGRAKVLAFVAAATFALTAVFSGAIYVVTTSSNASVGAGSLSIGDSAGTGAIVLSTSGLKPGDAATAHNGTVTITNNGPVAHYTLADTSDIPNTGLGAALHLKIEDITGPLAATPATIYDGNLGAFSTTGLNIDADPTHGGPNDDFASGGARTYKFSLSWPNSDKDAQSALQGTSVSGNFKWKAVQQ